MWRQNPVYLVNDLCGREKEAPEKEEEGLDFRGMGIGFRVQIQ
jgi:hypothetical protein